MALTGGMNRADAISLHNEIAVDNFSIFDTDLSFYSLIRSLYHRYPIKRVLDYGAGRNAYDQEFRPERDSFLVRDLRDLRFGGAEVVAADVSDAVLTHSTSHRQIVIRPGERLDLPDAHFDLIVSDYVLEHVERPREVADELQRLLKPGGWLVARTPNRYGYLKLAASVVPNRLHVAALRYIQPDRKAIDTFPTYYRLNSRRDISRYFDQCDVGATTDSWEPAYYFSRKWLYRLFMLAHRLLPRALGTATIFMLRKRG